MNINQILATVSQKARAQGLLNILDEASPIVQGFECVSQEDVDEMFKNFSAGRDKMKALQTAAAATENMSGNSWDYFKKAIDYTCWLLDNHDQSGTSVLELLNSSIGMIMVSGQDRAILEWSRAYGSMDDKMDGLEEVLALTHPAFHSDVRQACAWHIEINKSERQ